MEIGIVGLPNVGKSTLFNALTGAGIAAENFPFTTIEPNVGVVPLPDERLGLLAGIFNSKKILPAGIRFVDIAGLVQGASKGEGLGNQFLSHIRSVDAITHVVRLFNDENVVNVLGDLNPANAAEIIETELLLADLQQTQNAIKKLVGQCRTGKKDAKEKMAVLEEVEKKLSDGISVRNQDVPEEIISEFQFLTAKPLLYVANTDEGTASPQMLDPLKQRAEQEQAGIVVLCTKLEAEIVQLPEEERAEYYEQAGIASPGLAKLAQAGCKLLDLVCFFTAGPQETRAWLVPRGTPAVKAAGKIHSDIERGFIRAEVYTCEDIKQFGSEKKVQENGLIRLEGKDYEIKDGDVVYFRFNV